MERQTKTTAERDEVRDSYLHVPESRRIFVHSERPDFEQTQVIKDFLDSVPPIDPIGWCLTVRPNVDQGKEDKEAKPKKGDKDKIGSRDPFSI